MQKLKYIMIVLITNLCLIGCNKDYYQVIEGELQVHFSNFENEAATYGVDIDISAIDISAYIQNIETLGTLGQCKSYSDGSQQVIVDEQYWNRISDEEREYLVFHELGHCILKREHNDSKDENGSCISIMQSGTNGCKSEYSDENRAQLLKELFIN